MPALSEFRSYDLAVAAPARLWMGQRNPNHQLKMVVNIPLFIGVQPSKVVQDFFHPQEVVIFAGILFPKCWLEVLPGHGNPYFRGLTFLERGWTGGLVHMAKSTGESSFSLVIRIASYSYSSDPRPGGLALEFGPWNLYTQKPPVVNGICSKWM